MNKLFNTQTVKEMLGIGRSTVNKLALENNIGQKLGVDRAFNADDIEQLRSLVAAMPGRGAKGKPRRHRQPKQAAD